MSIIFYLIPLTLVLVGIACWAFFWAVSDGQFDDLETPAWDVLRDEEADRFNMILERDQQLPIKTNVG